MNIQELFDGLSYLGKKFGIIWTIGSGEEKGFVYGGIAHLADDLSYRDIDNWIFDDDLISLLCAMVDRANENVKMKLLTYAEK